MNTRETLDAISRANDNCSDYRIAAMLGISRQWLSDLRNNKKTMGPALRIKAAKLLNHDPALHLMYGEMERAKSTPERHAWQSAVERLTAVFMLIPFVPALLQNVSNCILCQIRQAPRIHPQIHDNCKLPAF